MDIRKEREAFEQKFRKTSFCKNMVKSLENSDCPFTSVFEMRNGKYRSSYVQLSFEMWQAAKAVPEGFVLIKDDTKTVVAIERMVEQRVEASGMDSRRLERLDGWKIIEAAVKAQEPTND